MDRAVDLGCQQVVVDRAGRRRVGKARDDERVIALDRDRALGQDALVVGDGAGHHDDVVACPWRASFPFSSVISASFPAPRAGSRVGADIDR